MVASTENHEPACVQGNGKPASSVQENMQMVLVRENMKTASTSYKGGKHEKGFNGVKHETSLKRENMQMV